MKEWPPNGELSNWIAAHWSPGFQGYAVDVGASDGISVNTTYVLEKMKRWTVLCIEPNPVFRDRLKQLRPFVLTCACDETPAEMAEFHSWNANPEAHSALRPTYDEEYPLNGMWTKLKVPVRTLDQCLAKAEFPRLDALCIDVEGTEIEVLKGCDLKKWEPRVIIAESWEPEGACDGYLAQFGYRKVGRNAHNNLYQMGVR